MKKITWTWKKIVTLICGALGIGTLVSCYGVVNPTQEVYSLSGSIVNEEGKTIPGIRVSAILLKTRGESDDLDYPDDFDYNGSTRSDDDGTYYLSWEAYGEYTAYIYAEDVDGDENGSFKNQLFDVDYSNVEGVGSSSKPGFIYYNIKNKKLQLTKKTDNEDTNE